MALPDDDRRAVAARLATSAPGAVDVLAGAVDEGEELREVLVDVDAEVVALTDRRALLLSGGSVRAFDYREVAVRRRADGLGIDALVEGDTLVLDVARSTFVRLGVVAEGSPPGRATWLPLRSPLAAPRPEPEAGAPAPAPHPASIVPSPPDARSPSPAPVAPHPPRPQALPPPGWHPDPSGRHWWRWWDGRGWTDHVADGGAPYVDPLPPR